MTLKVSPKNVLKLTGIYFVIGLMGLGAFSLYFHVDQKRVQELAQLVADDINNPDITVRFIENTLVLEGVTEPAERDRAEVLAQTYMTGVHLRNYLQRPRVLNLVQLKGNPIRETASVRK